MSDPGVQEVEGLGWVSASWSRHDSLSESNRQRSMAGGGLGWSCTSSMFISCNPEDMRDNKSKGCIWDNRGFQNPDISKGFVISRIQEII